MTIPTDEAPVVDDAATSRFVVREGGTEAELVYALRATGSSWSTPSVPDEWGGRGIGGRLVRAALDRAETDGLTVVPWCPFARRWLHEHPDEAAAVTIDWETPRPPW